MHKSQSLMSWDSAGESATSSNLDAVCPFGSGFLTLPPPESSSLDELQLRPTV